MPLTTLPFLRRGKNALQRKEFPQEAQNLPEWYNGQSSEKKNTAPPLMSLGRFQKATVQISYLHRHSFFERYCKDPCDPQGFPWRPEAN